MPTFQPTRRPQAIPATTEVIVQDRDVVPLLQAAERLVRAASLGDHDHVGLIVDQLPPFQANRTMIVREEHPDWPANASGG